MAGRDHRQAVAHRLDHDPAERVHVAREQQHVALGVQALDQVPAGGHVDGHALRHVEVVGDVADDVELDVLRARGGADRLHAALLVERGADEQHAQRPVAAGLRRADGGADRRAERRHLVRDAVTDDVQQPVAGRVRPRQQVLAAVVEDGAPESLARPRPGQRELLVEREHAHLFEIDHVGLRRVAQHELGAVDEVHVVGDARRREPHVAGAGERPRSELFGSGAGFAERVALLDDALGRRRGVARPGCT